MDSYFLDENGSLEEEKLDLSRYTKALTKRWWLVLVIAVAITIPWLIYLQNQPPIYEAETLIRFKSFAASDPALLESRITELKSRSFAEKVVAQLGLTMNLEDEKNELRRSDIFEKFSTTKNPVKGDYILRVSNDQGYALYKINPGAAEQLVKQGSIDEIRAEGCTVNGFFFKLTAADLQLPMDVPFGITTFRNAVKTFQDRINVNVSRSGNYMSLSLTDTDPVLVAEMTNRLAQIFVDESASMKKESVKSKSKILKESLEVIKEKLDASDRALKDFKERYGLNLDTDQKNQVYELSELERQKNNLMAARTTLKDLLSELEQERRAANGSDPNDTKARYIMNQIANLSVFDDNATMLVYRPQLEDLEERWKSISSSLSSNNIKAKEILQQIKQLHVQIESVALQEITSLESDLAAVNQEANGLNFKLKQLPSQQQQLGELTRANKVLERQYLDLLAKNSEAALDEAVETEDIEILDPALEPEFPTNRDKKQKAAFGGVLGLIMGIGVTLVIEFFDKSIKTVDEVKKYLKLKVLGTIPQIDFSDVFDFQDSEKIKQIDQQLVTHDYAPSPIGEAYRSLRTNLLFSKENGRIQSLVITSNEPGDGKSFTAANLAITFAQLKSNTILIDTDLRRGVLHNTFGLPKEPGFSNYLTNMVPLQSILHETHIPNLTLISCGSMIPNPSELLGSHQMQRFIDEVRRKYDLIIFDSPPLNAATDAVVIGTQVDGTVIVIRAAKTNRDLARQKLELFSNVPARVLGIILNGTTADMAHPGYSYYHY